MTIDQLPCCFFPSTVLFVDDNRKFLNNLKLQLDAKYALYEFFDEPSKLLNHIAGLPEGLPLYDRCLNFSEEHILDHRDVEICLNKIYEEVYLPKRFEQISVVVADYAMPEMNGLDLCKKIKRPIKKLLLTGEADEKLAISAFNRGIIHKFIRKDVDNFEEKLREAIFELQLDYFADLSRIVVDIVTKNPLYPPSNLDDPIFIENFQQIFKRNNIVEYYLQSARGDFILFDAEGKVFWLSVATKEIIDAYVLGATGESTEEIITALKQRKLFPVNEIGIHPKDWKPYMFPVSKIEGRDDFFMALGHERGPLKFDRKDMVSFKAYCRSQDI